MAASRSSESPVQRHFGSVEEELTYYKSQYEHLATELHEFQETSAELELELERDAEAAEKREKQHRQKIEALGYEVEQWKTKYKTSKNEANSAQANLQQEITTLRDANRTMQLKLRDMEVTNDDYERQARNTTSSLDDMMAKFDNALDRSAMLEEEVRLIEQEREELRIETQRLRDELSDLRVETDILRDKLQAAEAAQKPPHSLVPREMSLKETTIDSAQSRTLAYKSSPVSTNSTPTANGSERLLTGLESGSPPSPPLSEFSTSARTPMSATSSVAKPPLIINDETIIRPPEYRFANGHVDSKRSVPAAGSKTPRFARPTLPKQPRSSTGAGKSLPRSGSLYQIRGLMGKMQKLEERVQSVKSKLPAPSADSPSAPSPESSARFATVPETVTMRRASRRASEIKASTRPADPVVRGQPREPNHGPSRPSLGNGPRRETLPYLETRRDQPLDVTTKLPAKSILGSSLRPSSSFGRALEPQIENAIHTVDEMPDRTCDNNAATNRQTTQGDLGPSRWRSEFASDPAANAEGRSTTCSQLAEPSSRGWTAVPADPP